MGYSILKSADIIPEEMELLKQIEGLKKSLDSCTSQIEKRAIQRQLSEKITNFNMRMERSARLLQHPAVAYLFLVRWSARLQ
jgi:uncharacterized protein YutE (UPF0331/DUF86 family)